MRELVELYRLRLLRTWKLVFLVSSIATSGAAVLHHYDIFGLKEAELGAYDEGVTAMTGVVAPIEKSKDIIILAIDDLTLQAVAKTPSYALNYGQWPYSRNVWARVIEHLGNDGARAVVFDAVMDERHTDPTGDLALGEILKTAKVPYYVGFNVSQSHSAAALPKVEAKNKPWKLETPKEEPKEDPKGEGADDEEEFPEEPPADEFPEGEPEPGDEQDDGYPKVTPEQIASSIAFPVETADLTLTALTDDEGNMRYPQPPIAPLLAHTAGFGLVVMEEDGDGKLRHTRFAYSDGVNTYVTLPVAVAADLFGAEKVKLSPGKLEIGSATIEVNPDGSALIDYGGDLYDRFQTISLIHVLDDWAFESIKKSDPGKAKDLKRKLEPGTFKDKVVVIGGFALGTADVKGTPFAAATPGVVKQASEVQNLLDKRYIIEAPFWSSVLITFLIAAFSMALVIVFRNNILDVVSPLVLFYGFFLFTGFVVVAFKIQILSAMPAWAASFASAVGSVWNHLFASRDRDQLKEAFNGHVSGILLDQLIEQDHIPSLAGEHREVTALVTDMNNFSDLSDKYTADPSAFQRTINRYHTALTEVVQEHGGYVNKYIGDSMICLFGAPFEHQDHAVRACRAALAIVAKSKELQASIPELTASHETRVGITSARMFVGNFGSDQRADYTAVGDEMRVAARIERENEKLGTVILVSQRTVELAEGRLEVRPKAEVVLLEGEPPQRVYELVEIR